MVQPSLSGTVPNFSYSINSTKDGTVRAGTMVGTSPFVTPITGSTISTVIVPVAITIGATTFDPTAINSCDGSVSALSRFQASPLLTNNAWTMNGINVGTTQYIDAFRRGEFWGTIGGSALYTNPMSPVAVAPTVTVSALTHGTTFSSGCGLLGIVSSSWISSYLSGTLIPSLQTAGTIDATKFVIFLTRDVVQSTVDPPTVGNCCILGYHSAQGSPVQTYTITDWDTTGDFGSGTADGSVTAHEIGEWMDDPIGTNPTPNWGGIGQVSGCQGNYETGDPLSGTLMPAMTLGGKAFHMQELAYFSWFFNKLGAPSLGTVGRFSSNGTFKGPSKPACVGTFAHNAAALPDFDGDAKTDWTVWRPSTGLWYTITSSTFTASATGWGLPTDVDVTADYDGDGKADRAIWRPSTGDWWIIPSSTGVAVVNNWGVSGDIPMGGDMDGDGIADLVVYRPSTNVWWAKKSAGGTSAVTWGTSGDQPLMADFDGDGKKDFVIYRPSSGVWYVLRMAGGTQAYAWGGTGGDIPVAGDFDGDGKADPAIFRSSTGDWWILKSTGGVTRTTWGTVGDVPISADMNGDGKADLSIWRPGSTGIFYTQYTSGGSSVVGWGTTGDKVMGRVPGS